MPLATLRPATPEDDARVRALLASNGLPASDLAGAGAEFVVACLGGKVIGTGALQHFGAAALLRSVAVEPTQRGLGIGSLIVRELESRARASGVLELVLLTQTAESFFARQGYGQSDRRKAPAAVKASEEFRALCPASATCMTKSLAPHSRSST